MFSKAEFDKLEQGFWMSLMLMVRSKMDAKFASQEIALNADNEPIANMENAMDTFPFLKSIFMFPRTKANAISVVQTFDPTGATALWRDGCMETITASEGDPVLSVNSGDARYEGGTNDDFLMLKSEYIGRKLFTGGIVTGSCLATVNGQTTGSGAWMSPVDKQRAFKLNGNLTLSLVSPTRTLDWMRLSMS